MLLVTLALSQTAVSPVISVRSFRGDARKGLVAGVMTGIEGEEVEKGEEDEGEKPTEGEGIVIKLTMFIYHTIYISLRPKSAKNLIILHF